MADIFKPEDLVIAKDDLPTVSMGPYRAQWAEWAGYAMAFEVVPRACPTSSASARTGAT